ncbi:MAG: type II secretion system F family protein [Candidatus Aenigmarchaeota archaeon]|nr:type II secretion system F family protein [Candidatus Aenigmarchaeota archaeon]
MWFYDFLEWYKKTSYNIFSDIIEKETIYFESLKPDLKKANIKLSLREYLSIGLMTTILSFIFSFILTFLIVLMIHGFSLLIKILLTISFSMVITLSTFLFFYMYPSIVVNRRRANIDFTLPFATLYLATISGSNAPVNTLFKVLADFKDYGEISREAHEINKNIEVFGMSTTEALKRASEKSPSEEFKELLWGINTTLSSGGNLSRYLHEKSIEFMQDYRRKMSEYARNMSTLLEVYVTIIIVGSIFFIVISSLMSAFGLGTSFVELIIISQFLVIFIGLPIISLGFIFLLKKISPMSRG